MAIFEQSSVSTLENLAARAPRIRSTGSAPPAARRRTSQPTRTRAVPAAAVAGRDSLSGGACAAGHTRAAAAAGRRPRSLAALARSMNGSAASHGNMGSDEIGLAPCVLSACTGTVGAAAAAFFLIHLWAQAAMPKVRAWCAWGHLGLDHDPDVLSHSAITSYMLPVGAEWGGKGRRGRGSDFNASSFLCARVLLVEATCRPAGRDPARFCAFEVSPPRGLPAGHVLLAGAERLGAGFPGAAKRAAPSHARKFEGWPTARARAPRRNSARPGPCRAAVTTRGGACGAVRAL